MAHVVRLRPEGQRPYPGVRAVRADHEVEPAHRPAREPHLDPVPVLGQPGDPVAEKVFDVPARRLVQDAGEVTAHDLDLRDDALATEEIRRHRRGLPALRVYEGDAALVDRVPPYPGHDAHPLDHLAGDPAQVDRVPTGA